MSPEAQSTVPRWQRPRPNWGAADAPARCLPDFLIIGAQKAGTTSVFRQLGDHPAVWMPSCKECHFFDAPRRPTLLYRAFFMTRSQRRRVERRISQRLHLGEATPYYLFHPLAPANAARVIPDVRIIVLLRDPVERAWSHYRHAVNHGHESLPFEETLEAEPGRIAEDGARLERGDLGRSEKHQHNSYVARGLYAEQLKRWYAFFDRSRMHIEIAERYYEDPPAALARIEAFLGLPAGPAPSGDVHNAGIEMKPMSDETRQRLRETFAGPNRDLQELLGTELPWHTH